MREYIVSFDYSKSTVTLSKNSYAPQRIETESLGFFYYIAWFDFFLGVVVGTILFIRAALRNRTRRIDLDNKKIARRNGLGEYANV